MQILSLGYKANSRLKASYSVWGWVGGGQRLRPHIQRDQREGREERKREKSGGQREEERGREKD